MTPISPPHLSCGADPQQLLGQVSEGHGADLTVHQGECPDCQQALVDYQRLWAPFDALTAETVRAPQGMAARAVAWIRAASDDTTVVPVPMTGLPAALPGTVSVTTRVVIRCARLAAEEVAGVRLALSELATVPPEIHEVHSGVDDTVEGDSTETAMTVIVAADYGQDLQALATRTRVAVAETVRSLTGRNPRTVDVHIDEVLAT